ncbi:MAG TPA: hypothetical protein VHK88_19990 [Aquihabitans sp.]|jgi:hypothetical protein|nr:hypothetical protein [Aquihabitans sp.]
MSTPEDFLAENSKEFESNPPFKFSAPGDAIVGVIVSEPRVVEVDDLNGNGKVNKLVLDVKSNADGETYALWVNKGAMARAVAKACREAGVAGIAEGGTIALQHTSVAAPSRPGFNGAKQYAAKYQAPTPTVDVGAVFGSDAAQAPATDPFAGIGNPAA